jgi:hypothetical protein
MNERQAQEMLKLLVSILKQLEAIEGAILSQTRS